MEKVDLCLIRDNTIKQLKRKEIKYNSVVDGAARWNETLVIGCSLYRTQGSSTKFETKKVANQNQNHNNTIFESRRLMTHDFCLSPFLLYSYS